MKKSLILMGVLTTSLILSACTLNKKVDNDFETTYQNLFQEDSIQKILNIWANYDYTQKQDSIQIKWDNTDLDADIDIDIESKNNKLDLSTEANVGFDINIQDKKQNQKFSLNGILKTIFSKWDIFVNIQTGSLNLWTGNAQWEFINTMLVWIQNMRIQVNQEKIEYFESSLTNNQTLKQIQDIIWRLKEQQIFQNKGQTEYNWYNAYKIDLNKEIIQNTIIDIIENNTWNNIGSWELLQTKQQLSGFLNSIDFNGILVVKSKTQTDLIIEKLDIYQEDKLTSTIMWTLGDEKISLYIKDLVSNLSTKIKVEIAKRSLDFDIEILQNEKETVKIEWDLVFSKLDQEGIKFKLDGDIQVNLWDYYQTQELTPLEFNFEYISEMQSLNELEISAPDNSILLYQLLWDQFAMPTEIETENID